MLFDHSFNFIKDLNVLFVDITNQRGRLEYNGVKKFFQSDTMLWDFVHEYLPLKQSPQKIDALNVYDLLRANNMGFTHIEINGRRWDTIPVEEQDQLIINFKANVRKLKPQLLIVLGGKTYNRLFKNEVTSIRGEMQCGFKSHAIPWTKRGGIKEDTKVFLMRKKKFKTRAERNRVGKDLRKGMKLFSDFKKRHGSVFHPIRQTDDKRAENTHRRLAFARMSSQVKKMAVPNNILKKKFKKPSL